MRAEFLKVVAFLLIGMSVHSQKYKLGEVTVAELKESVHPKDTSAQAAYLFKKGRTYFEYTPQYGFKVVTEISTKIKIYKTEGLSLADQAMRYYTDGELKEVVLLSDAATYNLVDGKVVKSKVKGENEFVEKINKYWNRKKISMPNVKPGSIIEFKWLVKSPNFGELRDWQFQSFIPVNYSEYVTEIPEYFMYAVNQRGYHSPKVTQEKNTGRIAMGGFERTSDGNGLGRTVTSNYEKNEVEFGQTITTYKGENIPAMKDEGFVNNIDNYVSSISCELSSTKFPNSPMKSYATDWETVVKRINESEDFGGELSKTNYFEEDLAILLKDITAPDEKILAIFNHVKSTIKWNSYTGYSCDEGVKAAYKKKTGTAAEINLMLVAMLRHAGLNANPVILSTRSNGVPLFPSRSAFNYTIAAVQWQGETLLMDATEKNGFINILPERVINWSGRLIKKDGISQIVELSPAVHSKSIVNLMVSMKEDGLVSGKIRNQYFDYYALNFRDDYADKTEESYIETLEGKFKGMEIEEYKIANKKDLAKQIVEDYSFKNNGVVDKISDKLYFNPMLFLAQTSNPFLSEKREYPIDFVFPKQKKTTISISLPEGYAVESLPKSAVIKMDENIGSFSYEIVNVGNQIQVSVSQTLNWIVVPGNYYDILKNFYKSLVEKQTEKVVLKKA